MNKWIVILSGLLLVQLVAALAVNLTDQQYEAYQSQEPLLQFNPDDIDRIEISDDTSQVALRKHDGSWSLPQEDDFPAQSDAIEELLGKLSMLQQNWPVATSSEAAERFKVADSLFERKIKLQVAGQTHAELYVGSSPGFRKVHLRASGDDEIYALAFNSWEASAKTDDWLDKQILNLESESINAIGMPSFRLQREGEKLTLAGQEAVDAAGAQKLIDKIAGLSVQGLFTADKIPEPDAETAFEFRVELQDQEPLIYRFYKQEDSDHYALQRSDRDQFFKVAGFTLEAIEQTKLEQLLPAEEEQESASDSAPMDTTNSSG